MLDERRTVTHDLIQKVRYKIRWIKNRFRPGVVILLYHRVVDRPQDFFGLAVSKKHFSEHLEVVRQYCQPLALRRMPGALADGKLPRRGVVITFDDGYADNLLNAKPLLEQFEIPATVFVVSNQVGTQREFWWDELEQLVLLPETLPEHLPLSLDGQQLRWDLAGDPPRSTGKPAQPHDGRDQSTRIAQPARHTLLRTLRERIYQLSPEARGAAFEDLKRWVGLEPICRPENRPMSENEVAAFAANGLFEIGAHTMRHPSLAALPVPTQRLEIRGSRKHLESVIGKPVRAFSYPFGHRGTDYTDETVNEVRDAGFHCACAAFCGVARRGVDVFQVPRPIVHDWNGDELAKRLRGWFAWC